MKFIVNVRGTLKDADPSMAMTHHNATVDKMGPISKKLGALGHQAYLDPQNPRKFMAIDTWPSMESIQAFMSDASNPGGEIAALFEGPPDIVIWGEAEGWRAF
jgi:quinol monooxygenase YgiN